ncbi:caspase-like [Bombyx mandarina]|uniref:Caspase-like n=1 Tax=Bombyx mandarina TaxID=7092 RepID=A0A6J2K7Y5_BOMMA|nr:caspase-like [Bombyx mandarina]
MEETSNDFNIFNANPSNSSNKEVMDNSEDTQPTVSFDPESMYYNMSGDKYLIIFNHYTFKKTKYFQYKQPSTRNGTFEDVKSLKDLFEGLSYNVTTYTDLVYEDILNRVAEFCKRDHSKTSCVIVTILTHGDSGEVFAADQPYKISDLTNMIENAHHTLVGKPKIFFVQACRGPFMDEGRTVVLDGESRGVLRLPTHSDFLFLHSSVDELVTRVPVLSTISRLFAVFSFKKLRKRRGYLSYRDSRGSWLIQTLCEIIRKNHKEIDLLHMITMVNKSIAYAKSTYTPKCQETNNKKQMTETRFTLTKLFMFEK